MSVTIDWMDSRYTVIHANFIDHWDWGELQNALAKSHHLMTKSSRSVTLMLDFAGSVKATKTDSLTLLDPPPHPPNLVRLVIISDDPLLARKMEAVLHSLYPNAEDIQIARNHEEAFSLVRQTLEIAAVK
jgi:hypothetical protein